MVRYQPPMDWQEWVNWLAAGLHGRSRWRLSLILMGMLFAKGRRTVTTWLRAAGIHDDFADYYYFLQPLGRKSKPFAERLWTMLLLRMVPGRVLLVVDDTPTQRVWAASARRGHSSQSHARSGRSEVFVRAHLGDDLVGAAPSAVANHRLAAGRPAVCASQRYRQDSPEAPLGVSHQAGAGSPTSVAAGENGSSVRQNRVGRRRRGLCQAPLFETVVSGWRRSGQPLAERRRLVRSATAPAAARSWSAAAIRRQADFAARRAAHPRGWQTVECFAYGKLVTKTFKTFLATYRPAGSVIRVVIVREDHGCQFFFSTEPATTPREIIETFADRATIEQDFHDVKEVWRWPAASAQHLGEHRRVQFELVDAYAGGMLGLEPVCRFDSRPRRFSLGRRRPPSIAR